MSGFLCQVEILRSFLVTKASIQAFKKHYSTVNVLNFAKYSQSFCKIFTVQNISYAEYILRTVTASLFIAEHVTFLML